MAIIPDEYYSSTNGPVTPPVDATHIMPQEFGPGTALLPVLCMVAFDTANGYYTPWDPAGANGVEVFKGLLWPGELQLEAGGEKIAQVLLAGTVRREDVVVAPGVVATDPQIDAELQANARTLGIFVQNLEDIR